MEAVKILTDTYAGGRLMPAGMVATVPDEITARDADDLVRLGRAAITPRPERITPRRRRRKSESDSDSE